MKTYPSFMRGIKLAVLVALLATGCKQEEESLTQPDKQPEDKVAALVALGQKPNYTEAEAQAFEAGYKALSYEELIRYREVEIAQILQEYGNTKQIRELMDQNLAEWKEYNQKSIEQYGVASNQVSAPQVDALLTTIEQEQAVARSSARMQATCPKFYPNFTLGGGSNFAQWRELITAASVREVALGSPTDCDCEVYFLTNNPSFYALIPMNNAASGLLSSFGNSVSANRSYSGYRAVFGRTRVNIYYPIALVIGCQAVQNAYYLGR